MSKTRSPSMLLEIDETIIHSQLKISKEDDEFQQLLNAALTERENGKPDELDYPFKTVKPKPGFCVKTRNVITSQKIFVNVCHTSIIPAPADVNEEDLTRILESDEPSTFRIPMSLGEGHEEVDKSGQPCIAYDVAINSTFFTKVESSQLFQTFLITIAMEGLEDKYKMELDKNGWNILKNRRCFGCMQMHRIEQRHEKPFVQEVPKPSQLERANQKLIVEVVEEESAESRLLNQLKKEMPQYSIVSTRDGMKIVLARIPIWQCDGTEVTLSVVAEDCLSVKGRDDQEIVNVNLSHSVDAQETKAIFNQSTKILTVLLPVIA